MTEEDIKRFYKALRDTNIAATDLLVKEYIENKISPVTLLNEGLLGAMGIIGGEFKACQIWVPEVLLAARNIKLPKIMG